MNIKESIQQINELIEAWELNEACLNQTDIDAIKCLLKQNKELKQKYLNAVADYETTMAEKEQLKKQVEEYKEQVHKGLYNVCLPYKTGYNKAIKDKEIQQKEFIEYLENMLDDENDIFSVVRVKDVLQKYKETIGVSDEKEN